MPNPLELDLVSPSDGAVWVENRPSGGRRSLDLSELWRFRELVGFLALRDLKVRYKQAAFGILWALLQPIVGMAVLALVFRRLAHLPSDGVPYLPFVLLGYTAWTYFSTTLSTITSSFVTNSALVTKVYFPRLSTPVSAALPGLVDLGIGLVVVIGFMVGYRVTPTAAVLTVPLWLLALVLLSFGIGLLLATLNVQYRDVNQVVGLIVQLWFFASPVAYASSLVHGNWQYVFRINPMVAILDGFRWAVLSGPAPGRAAWVSVVSGLVILFVGLQYFVANERRFADII
jgi:ABC-type polysaccharide/polyol phosphate export permease